MCAFVNAAVHTCVQAWMHANWLAILILSVYLYKNTWSCVCISVCVCIYWCVHVCVHVCLYLHAHMTPYDECVCVCVF